jgi:hypothetical protein
MRLAPPARRVTRLALVLTLVVTLAHAATATATLWQDGDLTTYVQSDWGANPDGSNPATLLADNYLTVYASTLGLFEVGIAGAGGYSMLFVGDLNLRDFLPSSGAPGALDSDLVNPTSSSSGTFGGEVVSLKLNIDFSDASVTPRLSPVAFGDLQLSNLSLTALNGLTVREFSEIVNTSLGGGGGLYPIDQLFTVLSPLNGAFGAGGVSVFALDHLSAPEISPPPATVPEPGTLLLMGSGLAGLILLRRRRG